MPNRYLEELSTFFKQSKRTSSDCPFFRAIWVIPIIPFIGVRISWDICARKSDFAWANWSWRSLLIRFCIIIPISQKSFLSSSFFRISSSIPMKKIVPEYCPLSDIRTAIPCWLLSSLCNIGITERISFAGCTASSWASWFSFSYSSSLQWTTPFFPLNPVKCFQW